MKLCFNKMLFAFSYALDCVEKDCFKTISFHGKRVAYFTMLLGKYYQMNNEQINNLIGYSLLHDNGLSEYYKYGDNIDNNEFLKDHCLVGEENVSLLPFFGNMENVIKYHHERADGNGPFQIPLNKISLFSQLIHIIDWVDVHYDLESMSYQEYEIMLEDMKKNIHIIYSQECFEAFQKTITFDIIKNTVQHLNELLEKQVDDIYQDFSNTELYQICLLFARIIDSKSPFTKRHSVGVAGKAAQMAIFYQYDEDMITKIFFSGALHDVGKLVIDRDILEKPACLTDQEYTYIQTHAYYSYKILSDMGLGDIVHWSSFHHEKLDGSGYPFGKKAHELDFIDRLLACCDIYQALIEERPYKQPLTHKEAISIMNEMAQGQKIDSKIVKDIDTVFKTV